MPRRKKERPSLPYTRALLTVLHEAKDIAEATGQTPNSAHMLLAFFTTRNQAQKVLYDRGITEDILLPLVEAGDREPKDCPPEIMERSVLVATGCGAREIGCLHLLVAMTRSRESLAFQLLSRSKTSIPRLRTRALTILTGAVPRWLSKDLPPEQRPVVDTRAMPQSVAAALSDAPEEVLNSTVSQAPRSAIAKDRRLGSRDHQRPVGGAQALKWQPRIVEPARRPGRNDAPPKRSGPPERAPSESGARRARTSQPEAKSAPERAPSAHPREAARPSALAAPEAPLPTPSALPVETPAAPPRDVPPPATPPAAFERPPTRGRTALSAERFPWLSALGRNLSAEAEAGRIDPLVGRDAEIEQLLDILGKRKANNPCLVGEPGVGKTAVVEGLALRLLSEAPGHRLSDCVIIGLDVGALLIGTHLRGSFSEKLEGIKEEVERAKGKIIVFLDELHTLVGAGSTGDGPQDAANELKAALASGRFPCIGATTCEEYAQHIEPDGALRRRFVPVLIREPSRDEAIEMISRIMRTYARHHRVEYSDESIEAAVVLAQRFLPDRALPDKAIALLDLAGSKAARAAEPSVTRTHVAELVAARADLPLERVLDSDRDRLLQLEEALRERVVGHRPALERIAEVVRRNAAGFVSHRPRGSFLLLGPTGVGKTETAKALAHILHGTEDALVRFDLSEFSEGHTVSRLVGAPPGYVGHDGGGQLTEAIRKRPGSIVLLDEIEKAHPSVLQILLQVLDEGRLTDGHGRTAAFQESLIIMTSNAGVSTGGAQSIGFGASSPDADSYAQRVRSEARRMIAPELWGRIDEVLVYQPLSEDEIRSITRLLARGSSERLLKERGIRFALDDDAVDYILSQSRSQLGLGARPIRQSLARIIEAPIAARILEGRLHADEEVQVTTRPGGGLAFLVENRSLSQRPMPA